MKCADLHLHTIFSDGTYSPEKLLLQAHKKGLSAISVTDHDTVEAVEQSILLGKDLGIEVLPGIELTAECDGVEIHLLGYLFDYKNQALLEKLSVLKQNRVERIYKISDKLKGLGVELNPESVFELASSGTVGRLHVARAMVKEKIVNTVFEAFRNYIGDQGPGYVCGFRFSPQDAIKLIKQAGGIPVLAHPYTVRRDELIPELIGYGLMGLEVYYSEHTQSMINYYSGLVKQYNLLATGGSDCHGNAKPEVKIGSVKIPYELVNKLKAAKENLEK